MVVSGSIYRNTGIHVQLYRSGCVCGDSSVIGSVSRFTYGHVFVPHYYFVTAGQFHDVSLTGGGEGEKGEATPLRVLKYAGYLNTSVYAHLHYAHTCITPHTHILAGATPSSSHEFYIPGVLRVWSLSIPGGGVG